MTHIFNVAIEKRAYDDAVSQIKSEITNRFKERYDQDRLARWHKKRSRYTLNSTEMS